jgi:hypothetical protein
MSHASLLDDLVARARSHKMTPAEKRAQRVSLIMGLRAKRSTLTREKVAEILENTEGSETPSDRHEKR